MKLNALVLCRDRQPLALLTAILKELEIESTVYTSEDEAVRSLVETHYSGLVLDFDLPGTAQVAKLARITPMQENSVVFGLIGPAVNTGGLLQMGANVVLYKPLQKDAVMRALHAGRDLMRPDRRRNTRARTEALAYLQVGLTSMPALVVDLSEQGLALQAPESLSSMQEIPLRFMLPGTSHVVQGTGSVIWSDANGRAGMFFSSLKPNSRKHLNAWLTKHGARKRDAVRVLLPRDREGLVPHLPRMRSV